MARSTWTRQTAWRPDAAPHGGRSPPPSLEVSYDDGATWQGAELSHKSAGWRTALHAPRSARFVTLRVKAKDSADNSVSQTITRAFGLR
ncbi:hypothetical protein OG512_48180 [Streptomyces sp. NBC_01378]|uniref:hypothetical protein n=1 Tax=Streptomyces sp. NBC_01378 TaxID=2903844 RepID=UPI003246D43C